MMQVLAQHTLPVPSQTMENIVVVVLIVVLCLGSELQFAITRLRNLQSFKFASRIFALVPGKIHEHQMRRKGTTKHAVRGVYFGIEYVAYGSCDRAKWPKLHNDNVNVNVDRSTTRAALIRRFPQPI